MKIPACIFTYSGDALTLPWTVRGARLAGLIPVVCQDAAAPLPPQVLGWLEGEGVELRTTTFPRRGNLNGTDCAAGILRELSQAAARHRATHAFKLDTDTVVVRLGRFMAAKDTAVGLSWPQAGRTAAFGMFYGVPASAAAAAALELEAAHLDPEAPEDLTIWAALDGVCRRELHAFNSEGGPFTAMRMGGDVDASVRSYDVVTVGNPPEGGWMERDRQQAGEMRRLVEAMQMIGAKA